MMETKLQNSVHGILMRGGTSKGFFVKDEDFKPEEENKEKILLDMFGSPDSYQIDGIGGGNSHNSKFLTVGHSNNSDYDLEYTYNLVHVNENKISNNSISANITSAVGMFGAFSGLVNVRDEESTLSIFNRNTGMRLLQTIPVKNNEPNIYGEFEDSGIPKKGGLIKTKFCNIGGAVTGKLLPTGNPKDEVTYNGKSITVSVVDATRIVIFIRATDLNLSGKESPNELASNKNLLENIDGIRNLVSNIIGMEDIHTIAILSPAQDYSVSNTKVVRKKEIDLTGRLISLQPHHAMGLSPTMCLGAATQIKGSIPQEYVEPQFNGKLNLGHPKGSISVDIEVESKRNDYPDGINATTYRTARPLMAGEVYYRKDEYL